ncbi:hypothetical protein EDC04DRAFT_2823269, partial [Pisolithus marmoratus]
MPPAPIPVIPSIPASVSRSNVLRHVKRVEGNTDTAVIVLAVVCAILLLVVLFSAARYFYRVSSPFSPSLLNTLEVVLIYASLSVFLRPASLVLL